MTMRCRTFPIVTLMTAATFLASGCGGDPAVTADSGVPVDSAIATDASRLDAGVLEDAGRADMAFLDAAAVDAEPLDAGPRPAPSQQAYVKASNTDADDRFGYSVALSADGNTLAVGAYTEASNATGLGGAQADNSADEAGAVYVFTRSGDAWTQQAYIKASNTDAYDRFGWSVSLSADGNALAVGAEREASNATGIGGNQANNFGLNSGAVYAFTRTGETWTQHAYIKASNSGGNARFGESVSLSADGNTLAVGAAYENSNATGVGGDETDYSANSSGAVYVFTRAAGIWEQQAYVKASNTDASDKFGFSVSLSGDGNTLAVGAPDENGNATGVGGDQADNSASNSGAVYVFTRVSGVWAQASYVKASNTNAEDQFGQSVALSGDGSTLAVGAPSEDSNATDIGGDQTDNSSRDAGAVYVFSQMSGVWMQEAYVKASNTGSNDYFGFSVSLSTDGHTLAVGAYAEDSNATGVDGSQTDNSADRAGAAYVFTRAGEAWEQHAYVKASNTDANDEFGRSVALSADASTLGVGAWGEYSNATGVGGDELNNSSLSAGATYIFAVP